jgi:hypothetical protein
MKYTTSIEIDLPRGKVLQLIADPEQAPKWLRGLVLHEPVNGAHGQIGTTSRVVFQMGKQRMEATETITRLEPADLHTAARRAGAALECQPACSEHRGEDDGEFDERQLGARADAGSQSEGEEAARRGPHVRAPAMRVELERGRVGAEVTLVQVGTEQQGRAAGEAADGGVEPSLELPDGRVQAQRLPDYRLTERKASGLIPVRCDLGAGLPLDLGVRGHLVQGPGQGRGRDVIAGQQHGA